MYLTKWPVILEPDNRQNPELYYTTTQGISSTGSKRPSQRQAPHRDRFESGSRLNLNVCFHGWPVLEQISSSWSSIKTLWCLLRCQDRWLRHSIWCKHDDPTAATVSWRYWLVRKRKPRVFQCFQGAWALLRIHLEKVWNKLDETLVSHGQAVPQWCLLWNQVF